MSQAHQRVGVHISWNSAKEQEEQRSDFDDLAEKRFADIVASGKTLPWGEMRSYLENRSAGKAARRPLPKKLAR